MVDKTAVKEIFASIGSPKSTNSISIVEDGINTIYHVNKNGENYFVKFITHSNIYIEPVLMKYLKQKTSAPLPEVLDMGIKGGVPYFVTPQIEGQQLPYPSEMDSNKLVNISYKLGQLLGQFHETTVPVGRISVKQGELISESKDWDSFYRGLLSEWSEVAKKNYPGLGRKAKRLSHWVEIPTIDKPVPCLPDFHTRNVFLRSGNVTGTIDFERCYGGHPEFAISLTERVLCSNREAEIKREIRNNFRTGYLSTVESLESFSNPLSFQIGAILREMNAAHIWWEDTEKRKPTLEEQLEKIENKLDT